MDERNRHLGLIADYIAERLDTLCGEAVFQKANRGAMLRHCGIEPDPNGYGQGPWSHDQIAYADSLLADAMKHMAACWSGFRETEKRLCSAAAPVYEDEGDFD